MAFLIPLPHHPHASSFTTLRVTRRPRISTRLSTTSASPRARCTSSTHSQEPHSHAPQAPHNPPRTRTINPLLILTVLTVPLIPLLKPLLATLTTTAASLPPARAATLIGTLNFFTVLFCFPANMALMIAAGALLGPRPAFIALFTSKLLAAAAAFLLARRLFSRHVENFLAPRPRLSRVLRQSGNAGWKFVLLMRLSPFPGFLLNYLLSITGVPFWHYLLGTFVGILPSILNLVLVGDAARDVGVGIGGGGVRGGWLGLAVRLACVLSMVVVMVFVTRKVRQVFKDDPDTVDAVGAIEAVES